MITDKKHRLLLITTEDIIESNSSASITIRSFIKGYPENSVFQIVCGDFNVKASGLIRDNCFVLCHDDIKIARRLVSAIRKSKSSVSTGQVRRLNKKKGLKDFLRRHLEAIYMFLPYQISNTLRNHLNYFQPEAVYSYFVDYRGLILTYSISNLYNIPIFPHFMDDWPSIFLIGTIFFRDIFDRRLKNLIFKAPACFCISDDMASEYSRRYKHANMVPLMHSVPLRNTSSAVKIKKKGNTWLYAGSLYLNRFDTLIEIGKSLLSLGLIYDKIIIFCPQNHWEELKTKFEEMPNIEYKGFLTQKDLMEVIAKTDILLLIESYDEKMLDYSRFSLSTKIPEYLSSGKPILAAGNYEQGSIKYLSNNKSAFVAGRKSEIKTRILEMTDNNLVQSVLSNARKLFESNHVQEKQIDKFDSIIDNSLKRA